MNTQSVFVMSTFPINTFMMCLVFHFAALGFMIMIAVAKTMDINTNLQLSSGMTFTVDQFNKLVIYQLKNNWFHGWCIISFTIIICMVLCNLSRIGRTIKQVFNTMMDNIYICCMLLMGVLLLSLMSRTISATIY